MSVELEQILTDFEVDVFDVEDGSKRLVYNFALVGEGESLEGALESMLEALLELNDTMHRLMDTVEPRPRVEVN